MLVLLACGLVELGWRRRPGTGAAALSPAMAALAATGAAALPALAWTALKVGALSYGGGFVIIPLMQDDAVETYGWMTDAQFANAVAYGQLTPGPVVHTVAIVGWAAAGLGGALLAAAIAFAPSFVAVGVIGRPVRAAARVGRGAGVPRRRRPGGGGRDPRRVRAARASRSRRAGSGRCWPPPRWRSRSGGRRSGRWSAARWPAWWRCGRGRRCRSLSTLALTTVDLSTYG